MTLEARIDAELARLSLSGCRAVRGQYETLPPSLAITASPPPADAPPWVAALLRARTHDLDAAGREALFAWTAARPVEQAAIARDVLASRFVLDDGARAALRARVAQAPALGSAPPRRAVGLDDEALWAALATAGDALSDGELEGRVRDLDPVALVAAGRRGRAVGLVDESLRARWREWAERLAQAHLPTWASLHAAALARELGDAGALAIWVDVAGDDSLRYPGQGSVDVPSSAFGLVADRVAAVDLRAAQLALRIRRAANGGTFEALRTLMSAPVPAAHPEVSLRARAARVEAAVRLRIAPDPLDDVFEEAAARTGWRYGRWVTLLSFVAGGALGHDDVLPSIDEHWREFGGSSALWCELARFAAADDVFHALVNRALGDVVARPDVGDLWVAFAMCLGEGDAPLRARAEIWDRLRAQLP
jgi:hypothetical protein